MLEAIPVLTVPGWSEAAAIPAARYLLSSSLVKRMFMSLALP
jgi:hypothetical protein